MTLEWELIDQFSIVKTDSTLTWFLSPSASLKRTTRKDLYSRDRVICHFYCESWVDLRKEGN